MRQLIKRSSNPMDGELHGQTQKHIPLLKKKLCNSHNLIKTNIIIQISTKFLESLNIYKMLDEWENKSTMDKISFKSKNPTNY